MKKLFSLALSLLMVFSVVPAFALTASALNEDTVCVIGDTEYASLFGETGALANAAEGDTIVLVKDIKETGGVTLSNPVTIDLAGHDVINYSTEKVFTSTADITVRSTVDGLGETNTENQPSFGYSGTLFTASAEVDVSNVNFYEANNFAEYDDSKNLLEGVNWIFARYRTDRNDAGVNYSTYDNYTQICTETLIPVEAGKSYFFTYETTKTDSFRMVAVAFKRTYNEDGTYTDTRIGKLGEYSKAMGTVSSTSTATHIGITFYCSNNEWSYNSAKTKLLPLMNNGITPIIYEVTDACASVASKNAFITPASDNVKLTMNKAVVDQTKGSTNFMSFTKGCEFDVTDSQIKFPANNNKAAMTLNSSYIKGTFKNTTISMTQGFPLVISKTAAEGVTFTGCTISQNGSDQWYTCSVTGGTVLFNGGTIITGNKSASCALSISGGNVTIDDATIKDDKGTDTKRTTLSIGSDANVTIKKAYIKRGGSNSNLLNNNAIFLNAIADNCAAFTSSDYSADTVCNRALNFAGMSEVYVGPCGHYESSATCTEAGTCNYCLADMPNKGHDPSIIKYNDTQHWYKCSRCDYTEGTEDHAVGENGTEATCTTKPICGVCDQVFSEELGHSFTDYQPVSTDIAGCEHNPVTKAVCDRDGCEAEDYDYSALTNLKTTKEPQDPTCTEKGWTIEESCATCDKVINPSEDIPENGHTWGEVVVTEGKEPTYLTDGEGTKTCIVDDCGTVETVDIPKKEFNKDTVAIIGGYENPVQYASLFGEGGAFESAAAGDTIVLVNDTKEYNTVTIDKNITLDLAGYTLTSGSSTGGIITTANITVKSTVNGLGETDTAEKASVNYTKFFVTGSKVNTFNNLSLTVASTGSFFVSGDDAAELIVKNSALTVSNTGSSATALEFTAKAVKVDFDTVTIQSGSLGNGVYFNSGVYGTFKNTKFTKKQGNSVTVAKTGTDGVAFDGCTISQSAWDQTVFSITGGKCTLGEGTVVDGSNISTTVVNMSGGTLIIDGATIQNDKGTDTGRRLLWLNSDGLDIQIKKATLKRSTANGAKGLICNNNDRLFAALADECAFYYSTVPSGEFAYKQGTALTSLAVIYADACAHDEVTATCTQAGECLFCNKEFTEPLGHDFSAWAVDEANEKHYKICSRCNVEDPDYTAEAHTGGTATCEDAKRCEVCKKFYGEAAGHQFGTTIGYNETEHWIKCDVEGCTGRKDVEPHSGGKALCESEAVCTTCNQKYGSVLGHSFIDYISDGDASCTTNGHETATCANGCGLKDRREVANSKLGHNWTSIPPVQATCSNVGWTEGIECSRCHIVKIEPEEIAIQKNVHVWDAGKITVAGDCSHDSIYTYTCTLCTHTETVSFGKVADKHVYSSTYTVDVAATYFTTGVKSKHCIYCKTAKTSVTTIPMLKLAKAKIAKATKGKGKVTLKLKKVKGATGYEIRIKKNGKWVKYKTTKKLRVAINKLAKGTTYQVKVRAYVKSGSKTKYGKYSKVKKIKCK